MKKLILLAAWALPMLLFSQTLELEKKGLNELIKSGKVSQTEAASIGKAWQDLLSEFGGYPELPYNPESGRIEFVNVLEFPGVTKEQLTRRIEEWVSINYGSINSVLHYQSADNGKLIVKGWFESVIELGEYNNWMMKGRLIYDARCYHTVIFTVKPGKVKIEHRDLAFKYRTQGFISNTTYIPSEDYDIGMDGLYPVTNGEKETWKSKLRTIQRVKIQVEAAHQSIRRYIEKADAYDRF